MIAKKQPIILTKESKLIEYFEKYTKTNLQSLYANIMNHYNMYHALFRNTNPDNILDVKLRFQAE